MSNPLTESVDWLYPELAARLVTDQKLGFLAVDSPGEITIVGFSEAIPNENERGGGLLCN